ncbi:TonB-dependent receptor [uncultured Pseudoteredinibacter sp.]|uniref:TonB-dependent receptor n=1 Tax=uncultured Pseudoteredinibacter sp. TaxID=1641701 RepID=UPI002624E073|nr:TonB-dependent receptor [uncultured Pseudoteredinibacter sp.]
MKSISPLIAFPVSVLSLAVSSAFAQDAVLMEEIVVTAQKREQSIRDVPVTVSAFDGDFLKALDVSRYDELADLTPGLTVQQQSVNNNGYVIRGITSDAGEATSAPRVSVYLNGADVSRSRASYFEVYDMERVEVVKGPQATLFGTASSVGAMSFFTAKPEQDFSAEIGIGFGDYSARKYSGHITGGSEVLQGRLAVFAKQRDGYVENNSAEDDLNGYDRLSFRPSIRWTPSDDLSVDIVYTKERATDPGTAFLNQNLVFSDNAALSVPDNNILGLNDVGVDRNTKDINVRVSWDMNDQLTLNYIGSNRRYDSLEAFDADGIPQEFLNFSEDAHGEINSHEMRLNFQGDRLSGFAGVSQFEDEAEQRVGYSGDEFLFLACAGVLPGGCQSPSPIKLVYEGEYKNKADNRSRSVFGDISYALNDRLELSAGLRWTTEDRWSAYSSNLPVSVLLQQATTLPLDLFAGRILNTQGQQVEGALDDHSLLPRLAINYDLTEAHSAYLTLSKGQRSKVLQMDTGSPVSIDPEEVRNFEVGIKGFLGGDGISYSAAIFYQDYENFRVRVLNDGGNFVSASAGNATNIGIELEGQWQISEALRLFGNIGYIDAKVDEDKKNGEYAGNRFRLQPKLSGALGYLASWPVSDLLSLTSSATLTHRSSVFFDIANTYEEDAISLLKFKIGIASKRGDWSVELYADNLFDKEYLIDAGNTGASFGLPTYIQGAPRSYGLQMRKSFN